MNIAGTFFDGRTLRTTPVTLTVVDGQTLRVQGAELDLCYDLRAIRLSDRLGRLPRYLYLPDEATVACGDDDQLDAAFATLHPARPHARLIHFLESHSAIATVAAVLLVLLTAGIFHFGLPILTRHTAARTPAAIERKAGELALATFDARFTASTLNQAGRARVRNQLARLLPTHEAAALPRLVHRSFGPGNANALALPGGIIIVADELVAIATDDELAAVLAHEIGHLENRHGLQSILQSSLALLVVTAITGDLSTLTTFSATLPLLILTNGYSRDFEREADEYAHALLLRRGVRLKHFATVLQKLEQTAGPARRQNYLSTHPSTADRIRQFQPHADPPAPPAAGKPAAKSPAFSDRVKALSRPPDAIPPVDATEAELTLAYTPYVNPTTPASIVAQRRVYDFPKFETPPAVLRSTPVNYPLNMKRLKREGTALVDFVVDRGGDVRTAYVVEASNEAFAKAAIAAVEQWKFRPAQSHGQAVNAHLRQPIQFTLDDATPTPAP